MDDFTQINLVQFAKFYTKLNLKSGGMFGGGKWYVGANNTKYILMPVSVKDWQNAVANASDEDTICVDGFCKTKEQAERHIEATLARLAKTFVPSKMPSFAVMVSCFIVIGFVGISGKYSNKSLSTFDSTTSNSSIYKEIREA